MNKRIAIIIAATFLATALCGCGSKEPAPVQSTTIPSQSDSAQLTPFTDVQDLASDTSGIADAQEKLTELKSDFGYSISYDEESFDYRRIEGYDEFTLKSDALDKPFVFISISNVGAEFAKQAKSAVLGNSPERCLIGQAQIEGQYSQAEEKLEGENIIHKNYVCPLSSGDILIIETQWYTEGADDPYADRLQKIINSIKITEE